MYTYMYIHIQLIRTAAEADGIYGAGMQFLRDHLRLTRLSIQ